ncbi:MAG: hypothetical protein JXR89_06745, partial [Deltaproteobacteria bacterium]|nr:hypothetical protein [Deltaproteobacteria bacterium]
KEAISLEDKTWMAAHYDSFTFQRMLARYIEIYHQLKTTKGIEARRPLVREAAGLLDLLR